MKTHAQQLRTHFRAFLLIACLLLAIGTLFVYSASSVFALEKHGSSAYFLFRHLLGIVLGTCAFLVMRIFPLYLIKDLSPLFFLGSLGLTASTFIPIFIHQIHGSHRWLSLPFITFQPSELLKVGIILYLAYCTAKNKSTNSIRAYSTFLILFAISCLVLLKQPDFGMTVTCCITVFTLLFIMQVNTRFLLTSLLVSIPLGAALIYMKSYRWRRIVTFFNPWQDPQGAGFQLIQSLIAIGSGSWFGVGISHSKQKFFYLPMQHTDFIFAIIAEETGFIGALFLILLYILFLYFGIRIAWQLKDQFSSTVVLGFVIMISLQALINIAVTTGLVPTKGIGLPFVSYGNTSLICAMALLGLVANCVIQER